MIIEDHQNRSEIKRWDGQKKIKQPEISYFFLHLNVQALRNASHGPPKRTAFCFRKLSTNKLLLFWFLLVSCSLFEKLWIIIKIYYNEVSAVCVEIMKISLSNVLLANYITSARRHSDENDDRQMLIECYTFVRLSINAENSAMKNESIIKFLCD